MSKKRKSLGDMPADLAALLTGMDEYDSNCVRAAAKALRDNEGMLTPSESFIHKLLTIYAHHQRLMPGEVRDLLEDFEQELLNMAQGARTILRYYPAMLQAENIEAVRVVGAPQ